MATNPLSPFFTGLPQELIDSLTREVEQRDQPLALSPNFESATITAGVFTASVEPVVSTDFGQFIVLNTTAGDIIQILPALDSDIIRNVPGGLLSIADVGTGGANGNNVIITPNANDLINSGSSFVLPSGGACWIICDGVNGWYVGGVFDPLGGQADTLVWGNTSIAQQAGTRFMSIGYTNQVATTSTEASWVAPRTGILQNFNVRHNADGGNGNTVVYDVCIDAVPQSLGLTLGTGAIGVAVDDSTRIVVGKGDTLDVIATKALSVGGGGIFPVFSCLFL